MDLRECLDKLSNEASPGQFGNQARMLKCANSTVSILLNNICPMVFQYTKEKSGLNQKTLALTHFTPHKLKSFERVIKYIFLPFINNMDESFHGTKLGKSTLPQLLEQQDEVPKPYFYSSIRIEFPRNHSAIVQQFLFLREKTLKH